MSPSVSLFWFSQYPPKISKAATAPWITMDPKNERASGSRSSRISSGSAMRSAPRVPRGFVDRGGDHLNLVVGITKLGHDLGDYVPRRFFVGPDIHGSSGTEALPDALGQ